MNIALYGEWMVVNTIKTETEFRLTDVNRWDYDWPKCKAFDQSPRINCKWR